MSPLERSEDESMHGVLRHLLVEGLRLHHDADLQVGHVLLHDMDLLVGRGDDVGVVGVVHADLLNLGS